MHTSILYFGGLKITCSSYIYTIVGIPEHRYLSFVDATNKIKSLTPMELNNLIQQTIKDEQQTDYKDGTSKGI